ncbi:MAG TPA: GNAT family N-acetyltransferase [Candidatus Limnocylindrales bacterium]|nr:GNAT family N-acetyltransferase [Candidatus Limnocylindrales bacterium]
MYTAAHRTALIDLARRCLLPEDAREAEVIVNVLTRAPIGVVSVDGDRLIGAAIASAGHKDPTAAHLDLLLVDPEHRRRGVARGLLAELEQVLKARGVTRIAVKGNAPDYAWPGVDVRYTEAICALEATGYAHDHTAWNMTAPLPVPDKKIRETKDIEIRRALQADLETLRAMVSGEWGPAWTAEVERAVLAGERGAGGVHAAFRNGQPIAFAAWGGCRPSWFGPMGTLPAATGLGLGSILLRRCLRDQAALGLDSAQIGWVGPVPFYSNAVGAYIDRVFFLFSKAL